MTASDAGKPPKYEPKASTWIFLAVLIATGAVGYVMSKVNGWLAWLLTLGLMAAVVVAAGYNIKKLYFGFLVDQRNRYSLSRLQTLLWTLVVLSAYLTAVFVNLNGEVADPLAVAIPKELWVLMGISVTSLLSSPLIVNQRRTEAGGEVMTSAEQPAATKATAAKKKRTAATTTKEVVVKNKTAARKTIRNVMEGPPTVEPEKREPEAQKTDDGMVAQNAYSWNASWSDLFRGEMTNNDSYLDISRIQMFYFTFILVMVYCFQLFHIFSAAVGEEGVVESIDSLPAISGGMLALLGISHTAYLGAKAVPPRKRAAEPGETRN